MNLKNADEQDLYLKRNAYALKRLAVAGYKQTGRGFVALMLDGKTRRKYGFPKAPTFCAAGAKHGENAESESELIVGYDPQRQFVMQFVWSAKPGAGVSEEWVTCVQDFPA